MKSKRKMNEINQISDVNQIVNNIKEEISRSEPSSARIIDYLYDFRTKAEQQSISDSKYYDLVGETFKLNPEFYMNSIYGARKLYTNVNKNEMEKYIIEKFCMYEGESLLYECQGAINLGSQNIGPRASVDGRIYLTNYRIIVSGTLSARGVRSGPQSLLVAVVFAPIMRRRLMAYGKTNLIDTHQELPCYGYQFPIKNHIGLKKKRSSILYRAIAGKIENMENASEFKKQKMLMNITRSIKISPVMTGEGEYYHRNKLFELMRKDVNEIVDAFRELNEMRIKGIKRIPPFLSVKKPASSVKNEFLHRLRALWKSEEYQHLSDSEYFDIVHQIYKLDPEFFMTSIYPKMQSWNFPSFLSVKEELSEFLKKEGENIN